MKKEKRVTDTIKAMARDYGMLQMPEGAAERLRNMVVAHFRVSYSAIYRKEERLGRSILVLLICLAIIVLLQMQLSAWLLIPVLGFFAGCAAVILFIRKIKGHKYPG